MLYCLVSTRSHRPHEASTLKLDPSDYALINLITCLNCECSTYDGRTGALGSAVVVHFITAIKVTGRDELYSSIPADLIVGDVQAFGGDGGWYRPS